MEAIDYGGVGGMFVLYKIIEMLITNKLGVGVAGESKKESGTMAERIATIEGQTSKLTDLHDRYDADGVPLWYVPRSWFDTQKEIVQTMNQIANTQESIVKILDKMETKIDG
jgi:hypothetical protein